MVVVSAKFYIILKIFLFMIEENLQKIIFEYLKSCKLMHVSTLHEGRPRSFVCWFSVDKDFNFYFVSPQDAVHSLDIDKNSNVSFSIVNPNVSGLGVSGSGKFQGLMIDGKCERVRGVSSIRGALSFLKKFPAAKEFIKMAGSSEVKLGNTKVYKIKPESGVWFDQVNFKEDKVELEF